MASIDLFALGAQSARWLATRQALIGQNIANVNTPGFRAKDVRPFAEMLDRNFVEIAATQENHFRIGSLDSPQHAAKISDGWNSTLSGGSVEIEQEMAKAGDTNRAYALNVGVVKAFHRMLMSTVKV